ncbi:ABC transporter substrate-binding protein [bacterium 1XD42-1]|nr:ABC transporter substrate-binding protein [Oscillospiraceae bacterium]RKJ57119.1 ABC transporter substrate-binding protein [bacterium 1XD42-8]RKJ66245.1 ABC transporter substrate-binding protein [bacterium 1XD42-1]
MKKRIVSLLLAVSMTAALSACGGANAPVSAPSSSSTPASSEAPSNSTASAADPASSAAAPAETPEVDTIHWARANSGNIFVTLARQLGYFEEVGLTVIEDPVASSTEALTALGAGQVDVTSNQGTNNPLAQIAAGQDFTIVGGYMLQGMYLVAKTGTGWNGPEDLLGKKIAAPASTTTLTGPLLDLGHDPINEIEWLTYSTNSDRLAAVVAGEADYAYLSGDQLFTVGNMDNIEIVAFASDESLMPAYGCCRMNMRTQFVKENPTTVKLLLKSLIRAQAYFEAHKEECVSILAKDIEASEDYVAAYLLNENYKIAVDPVRNSVIKTWEIMGATGFLPDTASSINIEEHINIELYKTALDEAMAEYGEEYPEFYAERQEFFKQYNT